MKLTRSIQCLNSRKRVAERIRVIGASKLSLFGKGKTKNVIIYAELGNFYISIYISIYLSKSITNRVFKFSWLRSNRYSFKNSSINSTGL